VQHGSGQIVVEEAGTQMVTIVRLNTCCRHHHVLCCVGEFAAEDDCGFWENWLVFVVTNARRRLLQERVWIWRERVLDLQ
jgi:hypothetical protein